MLRVHWKCKFLMWVQSSNFAKGGIAGLSYTQFIKMAYEILLTTQPGSQQCKMAAKISNKHNEIFHVARLNKHYFAVLMVSN